jgi:hypothetical protein
MGRLEYMKNDDELKNSQLSVAVRQRLRLAISCADTTMAGMPHRPMARVTGVLQ